MSKLNVFSLCGDVGGTTSGNYFYEVIVFTGDRSESATQSKVKPLFFNIFETIVIIINLFYFIF